MLFSTGQFLAWLFRRIPGGFSVFGSFHRDMKRSEWSRPCAPSAVSRSQHGLGDCEESCGELWIPGCVFHAYPNSQKSGSFVPPAGTVNPVLYAYPNSHQIGFLCACADRGELCVSCIPQFTEIGFLHGECRVVCIPQFP